MRRPLRVSALLLGIASQLAAIPGLSEEKSGSLAGLGPSSVPTQLSEIEAERKKAQPSWPGFPNLEEYGLSLAADYYALAQHISDTPGDTNAAGGVFRLYGSWTPVNRGEPDAGKLVFKLEHRHRLGTDGTVQMQAPGAGVAGLSGPTFSDRGALLTNLYWAQSFAGNRFALVAGLIDVTDYLDVYGLVNSWTEFNAYAFATSPTIPAPDQGLGAGVRWMLTPNVYLIASLADANGDPHRPQDLFSSFFDDAEYFKHIEIGHIGAWDQRYSDNTHITLWQVDRRDRAGVDDDWGVALSWSRQYGPWQPFLRGGYADKGVAVQQKVLSTGVGYTVNGQGDTLGIGASWGQAAGSDIDQYTLEAYYKWQPFRHLLVVPDLQYIIDPAFNPSQDALWIAGVKLRATF